MRKWLYLSVIVIALDQWTKQLILKHVVFHDAIEWLSFLNITHVYNKGAAFSFLHDAGGWQHYLFSGLAFIVSGVMIWMLKQNLNNRLLCLSLALVVGGAVGNLIDRLMLGHVVDFIQVHYSNWYFPSFNIADSAITLGAIGLILESFQSKPKEENAD